MHENRPMAVAEELENPSLLDSTIFAFDVETTGLDPIEDRIVQLGGVFHNSGARLGPRKSSLINPGVPIPPEVTEIHGITDAMVAGAESFAAVGLRFVDDLRQGPDCEEPVLCGYNAPAFDVPFINAELNRHGIEHRIDPTRVLDPLVFVRWHHRGWRVRNLEAAARRCGFVIERAHSAADDAEAALHVLWSLLEAGLVPLRAEDAFTAQRRLGDLLEEEWRRFGHALYLDRVDGRPRVGFGAHCGVLLADIDREYLRWCLGEMGDLTDEARALIEEAAKRRSEKRGAP